MINFFRKARKNLADDDPSNARTGNVLKYSRYAVGEILLVVVGILIAIQINSWQETRKNIRMETKTLELLKDEYEENLKQLDEKISFRIEMIEAAFKLISILDSNQNFHEISKDSIAVYIGKTIPFPTFNPSMGVTNDIINSGKLYIIRNSELRVFLSAWSSNISQVSEIEQVWLNYSTNKYIPFLIDNYNYRNGMNELWKNLRLSLIMQMGDDRIQGLEIGKSVKEVHLAKLFQNENFEDHLSNLLAFNDLANVQSLVVKRKIIEFLEIIKLELKK